MGDRAIEPTREGASSERGKPWSARDVPRLLAPEALLQPFSAASKNGSEARGAAASRFAIAARAHVQSCFPRLEHAPSRGAAGRATPISARPGRTLRRGLIASPRAGRVRALSAGRRARRHNLRLCLGRRGWLACDASPRGPTGAASQTPRRAVRIMIIMRTAAKPDSPVGPRVVGRRARGLRRVVKTIDVGCSARDRRARGVGPLHTPTCRRVPFSTCAIVAARCPRRPRVR